MITLKSAALAFALTFIYAPPVAHAANSGNNGSRIGGGIVESAGLRESFQLRLNNAWHSMLTEKLANRKRVPLNIAPGGKYLMHCAPENASSQDKTFTMSFEDFDVPKSFSLIFIDEYQRVLVVAGTAHGAYIDDNTVQPEMIKKNSVVATKPLETYGHMDDTGYPYGAFGPSGTYAILLVDDAVDFGRPNTAPQRGRLPGGIYSERGKIPSVIAACTVAWTR